MKFLSKFSSSVQIKNTSSFESCLFKATSNSNSAQPTQQELYTIADHTYVQQDNKIRHRLQSKQKDKFNRIKKTMSLIQFLLLFGSIEFVAVICEKFRKDIEPYQHYSYQLDFEDKVRNIVKRIIDLSNDKQLLKDERKKAKKERDNNPNFGQKTYQQGYSNTMQQDQKSIPEKYDSYDPYTSNKSLQEKIGVIMEGVNQVDEKEMDKQEDTNNKEQDLKKQNKNNNIDLLDLGVNNETKQKKQSNQDEEVDFLQFNFLMYNLKKFKRNLKFFKRQNKI